MVSVDAFFLPAHRGKLFCLLHRARDKDLRGGMVYVHPFAEEMNKSRRMAALQARALAEAGWTVLQVDLFGCGDSEGDFGDADWAGWQGDIVDALAWLRSEVGTQPALWGMRSGCLLAGQVAPTLEPVPRLLLWQPVIAGKQYLQQFLRLKLTGQMLGDQTSARTGTAQLRERLHGGESIEIAGYMISPAMAIGLDAAELVPPIGSDRIAWLETVATAEGNLTPASEGRLGAWRSAGCNVDARAVTGPAFWQTIEIAESPALIDATLSAVKAWR